MKRELSPGIIAAIAVVVLVILGAWAWRNFAPPTARAGKNPYENAPAGAGPPQGGGPPPGSDYRNRSGGTGAPYGGGGPGMSGGPGGPPGGAPYGQPPGPAGPGP